MRKFGLLLKKELKELVTLQSILPLFIGVLIMFFIGNTIGGIANEDRANYGKMAVLNADDSDFSRQIVQSLSKEYDIVAIPADNTDEQALQAAEKEGLHSFIRIPKGFGFGVQEQSKTQEVVAVTRLSNLSITGSGSASSAAGAVSAIREAVQTEVLKENTGKDTEFLKNPVMQKDKVFIREKYADVSADAVVNAMMSQSMFLPIVMFIVITFASQMIAAAIANEKSDKTLETLLSAPVSRTSVLVAKMSGAGLVALIYAAVYMLSFFFYMNGVTGGIMTQAMPGADMAQAMQSLGLTLHALDYVIIGVQLFLGILIALSLSLIIGATAKDIKAAQAGVAPIIFLILIPYMLTLFTDIDKLPFIVKILVYILPFTHSFTTMNNLFLGNGLGVALGAIYQAVFLIFMIWLAVRLFNSDKIFTLKLEFRKRSRSMAYKNGMSNKNLLKK
jgi:ABC-2 type transport system permease protein